MDEANRVKNPANYKTEIAWKVARTKHRQKIDRLKAAVHEPLWEVEGEKYNRLDMMELLVIMVGEGIPLVEICDDERFPDLSEVRSWEITHPAFKDDMAIAEAILAERYAHQALQEPLSLPEDAKQAAINRAKLINEALLKHASFYSSKFVPKQLHQSQQLDNLTEDQIKAQLRALFAANPELADVVKGEIGITIEEISDGTEVARDPDNPRD
jgi:hypothetical protein